MAWMHNNGRYGVTIDILISVWYGSVMKYY